MSAHYPFLLGTEYLYEDDGYSLPTPVCDLCGDMMLPGDMAHELWIGGELMVICECCYRSEVNRE